MACLETVGELLALMKPISALPLTPVEQVFILQLPQSAIEHWPFQREEAPAALGAEVDFT